VASGADSLFTRRALGSHSPVSNAFAFRKYVVSKYEMHDAIILYHTSIQPGYGWLIPVDHEGAGFRYNIGAGWPLDGVNTSRNINQVMETVTAGIPEARELFAGVIQEDSWRGAPLKCGLVLEHCILGTRCIAIGEAVGTTYPFTGEGIGKAMLSGQYAADSLHRALEKENPEELNGYPEQMRDLLPRYEAYAKIEELLARPSTSKFLLNRLRNSPFLKQIADDVFHNDISPEPLLRPFNILKSYWK
jgi:flavin-dependent dehydrogenase